jgi:molybdate transport system substrate-binding protein
MKASCRYNLLTLASALAAASLAAADTTNRPVLLVFAASSATDCLTVLGKPYEAARGVQLKFNFASSSVLARQIEQGAPCDLFLSADQEWMDYLAQHNRIQAATRRDLLGNRLVIVTPTNRPIVVRMERAFDFPASFAGRLAVGDPAHVPAGKYAREALQQMGWWEPLEKRLAPAENVRAALKLVERGECDAGIVYRTDARGVAVAAVFPESSHKPIRYPVALCVGARPEAADLLTYLAGADAAAVWTNAGFTVTRP